WRPSRRTVRNSSGSSINSASVCPRPRASGSRSATSARARAVTSDVKVLDLPRAGLDEVAARLDALAHERAEHVVGLCRVLDVGAQEGPRLRAHRGFPKLIGVHLAQALEPLDAEVARLHLLDDALPIGVVVGVPGHLAGADAVERRL